MIVTMDEIVNAICLHMAERKHISPEEVQVELRWEEHTGYTGKVWIQGQSQYIIEANIKEAIIRFLDKSYHIRVYPEDIQLQLDEEITATVTQQ